MLLLSFPTHNSLTYLIDFACFQPSFTKTYVLEDEAETINK